MLRKAIHRIKMRRLRRMLRGHRNLKKMNARNEIFSIKDVLAVTDCVKIKKISLVSGLIDGFVLHMQV